MLPTRNIPQSARPSLSQQLCLPSTHDASLLIYPEIIEQTGEEQQLTSPVEDIQQSSQQPTVPVLDDTGEIEQHGRDEMNGNPAGAVEENDMIQPGECRGLLHLAFATRSFFKGMQELHTNRERLAVTGMTILVSSDRHLVIFDSTDSQMSNLAGKKGHPGARVGVRRQYS